MVSDHGDAPTALATPNANSYSVPGSRSSMGVVMSSVVVGAHTRSGPIHWPGVLLAKSSTLWAGWRR
eukprot:CAMPEP_0204494688 /NCGR_PEP_ID=MMETSP0471-20130131/84856_1 /ASSEMBLY_ACC=CAM_ASM_000602 /TAXON_ID=2969 /ORGANISM="Oxyrrhis marina" /LENGTH=66 /DNA_ID=CAMNT_0051498895 /DNA_START=91 /DNA_END=288 /DNA_ORIENTATION=+